MLTPTPTHPLPAPQLVRLKSGRQVEAFSAIWCAMQLQAISTVSPDRFQDLAQLALQPSTDGEPVTGEPLPFVRDEVLEPLAHELLHNGLERTPGGQFVFQEPFDVEDPSTATQLAHWRTQIERRMRNFLACGGDLDQLPYNPQRGR